MSKFYDKADAIAAALATVELLDDARIVVNRQHDLASELQKVIGKQTGNLILVTWAGGSNTDESADGPRIASNFNVTIFSKPVIRPGETPADNIAEAVANHLHDWKESANDSFHQRLIVTGIFPIEAPQLLIHEVRLRTPSQL